jgi:hypothetical protein
MHCASMYTQTPSVSREHPGTQSSPVFCNVLLNRLRRRDRKNGTSVTAPTSGAGGSRSIPPPSGAGNLSVTHAGTAALMKEINTYLAARYDPRMRVELEEIWATSCSCPTQV